MKKVFLVFILLCTMIVNSMGQAKIMGFNSGNINTWGSQYNTSSLITNYIYTSNEQNKLELSKQLNFHLSFSIMLNQLDDVAKVTVVVDLPNYHFSDEIFVEKEKELFYYTINGVKRKIKNNTLWFDGFSQYNNDPVLVIRGVPISHVLKRSSVYISGSYKIDLYDNSGNLLDNDAQTTTLTYSVWH